MQDLQEQLVEYPLQSAISCNATQVIRHNLLATQYSYIFIKNFFFLFQDINRKVFILRLVALQNIFLLCAITLEFECSVKVVDVQLMILLLCYMSKDLSGFQK